MATSQEPWPEGASREWKSGRAHGYTREAHRAEFGETAGRFRFEFRLCESSRLPPPARLASDGVRVGRWCVGGSGVEGGVGRVVVR